MYLNETVHQTPAQQFLGIAGEHFRAIALERIRAQPFFGRVQSTVRDAPAHPLDGLASCIAAEVDHLDPLACDRGSLQDLIGRTAGEPRAFLVGVLEMRERIAYITGCPF